MRSLVACFLISLAAAKYQTGIISVGGDNAVNKWQYISKFSYQVGKGTWSVRYQVIHPHEGENVSFHTDVYLDDDWAVVEDMSDQCSRVQKRKATGLLSVPSNGEWSEWVTGTLSQTLRPHVWYFAAQDCTRKVLSSVRLRYEFRATQYDGSEFSAEVRGSQYVYGLEALFYCVLWYFAAKSARSYIHSFDYLHPVMWTLIVMIALHSISVLFLFAHLLVYSGNGHGIKPLEVSAEIVSVLSQVVTSSLLILISLGYTLLHSQIGSLDVVIPIVFIIAVVHVLLVGFGKIKDDASFKFYENEGYVGYMLLALRLLLLGWFLYAVRDTAKSAGNRMKPFLRQFVVASVMYFVSYPIVFVMTGILIAPYNRYNFMVAGQFILRVLSNMWLFKLFMTRSEYFKVSTVGGGILPGGLRGLDKEE